jgi:hypothetical protein
MHVIAKAEPEAIQKVCTAWIASRFVPRGRNADLASCIVIAKAEPDAIHVVFWIASLPSQ